MPDPVTAVINDNNENIKPNKYNTRTKRTRTHNYSNSVTPPKLKCCDIQRSDTDVESKTDVELSPNTLLSKLDLGSPRAGRKSVKQLFGDDKFQNARQALHSSVPDNMPGREKELEEIENFIKDKIMNNVSGTLYLSGPPGTGKTAALSKILSKLKSQYKEVYINCTSVKTSITVFSAIVKELSIKVSGKSEKDYVTAIENYLTSKNHPVIMVLDEIDQLDSRKQSVLYKIFEWPTKANSKLVLIGIANALDFTDRTLPRLQSRLIIKPKLMHFNPYDKQQIVEIVTDRLKAGNVSDVFSPLAIQMLAAKVSAVSGDVRRALDISRRTIELAEQTRNKHVLQPTDENCQDKNIGKPVELGQVVSVLNNVYGTSHNLQDDVDDSIPLQQKLLLCSLILLLKNGKKRDILVGKLHEVYRKICAKRNLAAVDQSEFVGLCSLIETRGIIKIQGKKTPQLNKVCLQWDEDEVADVLKDKRLLSSVLDDDSVVAK